MEQVPPEVVVQVLIPPVDLPFSENVEGEMIEQENSSWTIARRRSERAHIDSLRSAMHGVGSRISRPGDHLFRLDRSHDCRLARIGLGINYVKPRRTNPGHDKVAPFDMRMRRVGAERRTAGVPAEVVQFVAEIRQSAATNFLTVGG